MSLLSKLAVKEKTIDVEYPGMPGFVVKIGYMPRETLVSIREQCLSNKYNPRTRVREDVVNNEEFTKLFIEKAIKGWEGLTLEYVSKLMPVNLEGQNPKENVPYTPEDALLLVQQSTMFDQFITDATSDIASFSEVKKQKEIKN